MDQGSPDEQEDSDTYRREEYRRLLKAWRQAQGDFEQQLQDMRVARFCLAQRLEALRRRRASLMDRVQWATQLWQAPSDEETF